MKYHHPNFCDCDGVPQVTRSSYESVESQSVHGPGSGTTQLIQPMECKTKDFLELILAWIRSPAAENRSQVKCAAIYFLLE